MAFRNLSSSETGSEQFEVACNFEATLRVCFFSAGLIAGLTQQAGTVGKKELLTRLCCYAWKYVLEYS